MLVQNLEIFQRSAGVFQLHARLAQLRGKQTSQISDRQIGKEIDEDNRLQHLQFRMGAAVEGRTTS